MAAQASDIKTRKKYALGGMMNPEEARMNRALLHEIARVKRGEEPTSLLTAATNNPFWMEVSFFVIDTNESMYRNFEHKRSQCERYDDKLHIYFYESFAVQII